MGIALILYIDHVVLCLVDILVLLLQGFVCQIPWLYQGGKL